MSIDLGDLPAEKDYSVATGDSNSEIRDPLQIELNGDALNLTDATWTLVVAASRGATATLDKNTIADYSESGVLVDDAAAGQITLVITDADIATLAADKDVWYYSLHVVLPSDHAALPSWDGHIRYGEITITDVA